MVMSQTLEIIRRFNIVLQLQLQSYNTGHCMVEADNMFLLAILRILNMSFLYSQSYQIKARSNLVFLFI
jgi:hypothetical protein